MVRRRPPGRSRERGRPGLAAGRRHRPARGGTGPAARGPVHRLLSGGGGAVQHAAETWFRIAVTGVPGVLLVLAGNGWMRGVQDTRRPVVIVLVANGVSAILSPVLVYAAGMGLPGRPWRTCAGRPSAVCCSSVPCAGRAAGCARVGGDSAPTGRRPRFGAALGRIPGRVPDRGGGGRADGHGADRCAPDRPAAVGVHRAAARLVRHRGAVAGRRGAGRERPGDRPAHCLAGRAVRPVGRSRVRADPRGRVVRAAQRRSPRRRTSSRRHTSCGHGSSACSRSAGWFSRWTGCSSAPATSGSCARSRSSPRWVAFAPLNLAALHWHWGIGGVWAGLTAFIVVRFVGMVWRTRGDRWVAGGGDPGVTDGLVIVDKPAGWTSHDVVARIRRLARTRRVGHSGTLDPMATGVLVLGVGKATRLLHHLVLADKAYTATIRLGESTTTDDSTGEVISAGSAAGLTADAVRAAMQSLTGGIAQVPSAVSAIKLDGQRAYQRVRAGESVRTRAAIGHRVPLRCPDVHPGWRPAGRRGRGRVFVRHICARPGPRRWRRARRGWAPDDTAAHQGGPVRARRGPHARRARRARATRWCSRLPRPSGGRCPRARSPTIEARELSYGRPIAAAGIGGHPRGVRSGRHGRCPPERGRRPGETGARVHPCLPRPRVMDGRPVTAEGRSSAPVQRWRGLDAVPGGWGRCAVTIGVFDGVHRAHAEIIRDCGHGWLPNRACRACCSPSCRTRPRWSARDRTRRCSRLWCAGRSSSNSSALMSSARCRSRSSSRGWRLRSSSTRCWWPGCTRPR